MIKHILERLNSQDALLLRYAMEQGLTNQYVQYRRGFFVGVNIIPELMPNLYITETAGVYSAGEIVPLPVLQKAPEDHDRIEE
jgi:hypothetical protein